MSVQQPKMGNYAARATAEQSAFQELAQDSCLDLEQNSQDARLRDCVELIGFLNILRASDIMVYEAGGRSFPAAARMHDRAAIIPMVVVLPACEKEVITTTYLLKSLRLYEKYPVSVMSGGHGYHNGASCAGIMIAMGLMKDHKVVGDELLIGPGCILGTLINTLQAHKKAVPHGDCFGVAAGGHFLTAGWDIALARRYGLGCQSVVGGRIVLWDGSLLDVNELDHPTLLHAMRGGAAAEAGVVTEIRLRLVPQPLSISRCFESLSKAQLRTCVSRKAFANATKLPRDISVSFRFHFDTNQYEPVCSLNVVSLLPLAETLVSLAATLGVEVTSLLSKPNWHTESLLRFRLLPASERLASDPAQLANMTAEDLHQNPLAYWKPSVSAREMASSYFTSISHWVVPHCEEMLLSLYKIFQSVRDLPARDRMYALVVQGGGCITDLQYQTSMPLGNALARFEIHWDDAKDERWSREITEKVQKAIEPMMDARPGRPYRGDIWMPEQGRDDALDSILQSYDRRATL